MEKKPKQFVDPELEKSEPIFIGRACSVAEANTVIEWLNQHAGACNVDWAISSSGAKDTNLLYFRDTRLHVLFILSWSHLIC